MPGVRYIFVAVTSLLIVTSACSSVGNYERVYFTKYGESYFVEMKGTRRLMAHDPFSALLGRTYEETLTIQLPRIEGVIKGDEIPVPADKLRYTGQIVITKNKMKVDLYYDDRSAPNKAPLPWNGEYTLVPRD
jgi:hypothetical protein